MCSIHDLIEKAKSEIDEDVEFLLEPLENEGYIAKYDLHQDIIFYSARLCSLNPENKFRIFMHELAHAKDFRSCTANGLLKILVPCEGLLCSDQANVFFRTTVEFQASNFLYNEFDHRLRDPIYKESFLAENIFFSLIPSIEYLCFGEDSDLREQFRDKLNSQLGSRWLPVVSLLKALRFADERLFETEFLRLMDCLGFTVRIRTEPIENRRRDFRILQNSTATQVRVFELVNFDINRFFNPLS